MLTSSTVEAGHLTLGTDREVQFRGGMLIGVCLQLLIFLFQLWDIGGQPRFRSMWERYCRGVNAIV